MSERKANDEWVRRLVAQDSHINDNQMKEFRMQLQQTVETSEANARWARRRIGLALVVYLVAGGLYLLGLGYSKGAVHDDATNTMRTIVFVPMVVSALAAMVIGVGMVVLYLFRYRPGLNRARFDLHTAMMLELQEQVRELAKGTRKS